MSRTINPLSSISYNTKDFLQSTFERLIKNQIIDFWCFIYHYGEVNEDGTKERDHFHVYFVPATAIDKRQIRNEFVEIRKNESLPRGWMPIKPSKWFDWYLYGLHDIEYLRSKGQTRQYYYSNSDFIRSDDTYFWDEVHKIDRTKINPLGAVVRAAQSGISFAEFVTTQPLGLLSVRSAQFVFDQVQNNGQLSRAGRKNHEPVNEDGEYIDPSSIK